MQMKDLHTIIIAQGKDLQEVALVALLSLTLPYGLAATKY